MAQNLLEDLETLLQNNASLVSDGKILKNVVIESAQKLDPELIGLLTKSESIRQHFFVEVNDTLVFDKIKFLDFVSNKDFLPDSFTSYKNKIGLAAGREYLGESRQVVLAWPYKDCVFEGGQKNEEESRTETFWNVTLAPDDISRLFEPKVFTKFERWDADAVDRGHPNEVMEICSSDNLLLKGNSLLALHSLKKRFAGKVKLIYIDPPYNTGNDGFRYNDRFTRSTWLTFMKNRLEVAAELLHPAGSIYVNIDFNQAHYLKVLMDEVFGEDNFQREIIWRIGWVSGYKTIANNFIRNHDTILFYSKKSTELAFVKQYIPKEDFEPRFSDGDLRELRVKLQELGVDKKDAQEFLTMASDIGLPEKYPIEDTWNSSIYDKLNSIAVVSYSGEKVSKMLDVREVKGQKPEALLRRIIESATEEGDLVLDFFAGTGTTCAAAMKLNRQWIGIEQLDYIEDTTKERLKRVIEGDRVGISKKVGWSGGGSFVYAELLEWNAALMARVLDANETKTLTKIAADIVATGYVRPGTELGNVGEDEFGRLSIDDQKRILIECLDMNHLHVNLGDIKDETYEVTEDDIRLNRLFYGSDDV